MPNTLIDPTPADHFTEEERRGRLVPDRHPDEHATCYVVRGRGLVVISSCSHCGVINAIRTAMAVSGVDKLHAVLGGFHLGVAPPEYVDHTISEMRALAPDVIIPMHCTGRIFIAKLRAEMPDRLIDWNTGSRFAFGVQRNCKFGKHMRPFLAFKTPVGVDSPARKGIASHKTKRAFGYGLCRTTRRGAG